MSAAAHVLLAARFRERWDEVFVTGVDNQRLSYGDVWSNAQRIADEWGAQGARPGDAIALLLSNGPAFVCAYVACIAAGYVAAPVNIELPEGEVAQILSMLAPRLVVREAPAVRPGPSAPAQDIVVRSGDERVCAVFFTSGTTGLPKGVRHRLSSLVGNVDSFNRMVGLDAGTRMYHVLPMAYMAGFLNTVLSPLVAGGQVILGPRFTAQTALSFWERPGSEAANAIWITPSIAAALCRATRDFDVARRAAQGMKILCGTAPLHDAIRERFLAQFGVPLQESYGTSELLLIAGQLREGAARERDVGRLLPELRVRAHANADGQPELTVGSPFAFENYLTAAGDVAPDVYDGFYGTGDIGELTDGRLRITGRIKDLIIRGGVNVAPAAIENALAGLPAVADVAVIGMPHEFWGEAIVVCIETSADRDSAVNAVRERCRERLGRAQQPDRIEVLERFPRAVTGKVQKNRLRALIPA